VIYLDTEYRDAREYDLHPWCACWRQGLSGVSGRVLLTDPAGRGHLQGVVQGWARDNETVCVWSAQAEARVMLACGIDIRTVRWLDGVVLWRWLTNGMPAHPPQQTGILTAAKHYGIATDAGAKEAGRADALTEGDLSTDALRRLVDYCMSDVLLLEQVVQCILTAGSWTCARTSTC